MSKLVELLNNYYEDDIEAGHVHYFTEEESEELAKYLEAHNVVIPPVDVGDKVWYIHGGYYNSACQESREIEVTEINKKKSGKTIDWAFVANGTRYKFSSIGKTVFLTKEACLTAINNKKNKNFKQYIV